MPSRHNIAARWIVFHTSSARVAPRARRLSIANTTDAPITKTKVGNTRSVAVRPFQSVWFMNPHDPLPPLLLTTIMNAIVIPRTTSRNNSLGAGSRTGAGLVIGGIGLRVADVLAHTRLAASRGGTLHAR